MWIEFGGKLYHIYVGFTYWGLVGNMRIYYIRTIWGLRSLNVDLILISPRVIAKSKCQNVITNPPVIAKSNQPKPKGLEASKSNVYYWLLLLWAMTTAAQLMDLDTLNYGGLGPHPRGGGGGGGGFLIMR